MDAERSERGTLCERCNLDLHRCPGCGVTVPHSQAACVECAERHQRTRLCDDDGIVRRGVMHKGTDYPCTGHAHYGGWRITCTGPSHLGRTEGSDG